MKEIDPFRTIVLVSLIWFTAAYADSIKVGKPELICTEDEIPIRYDGTITTLMKRSKQSMKRLL